MMIQKKDFEAGLLKYAPFREQNALKFAEELKKIPIPMYLVKVISL